MDADTISNIIATAIFMFTLVLAGYFVRSILKQIFPDLFEVEEPDGAELMKGWKPERPLRFWIDDLTGRTCAVIDHPVYGLDKLPWPDNEKAIIVIDEEYRNQAMGWWYAQACIMLTNGEDIRKANFPELMEQMKRDLLQQKTK